MSYVPTPGSVAQRALAHLDGLPKGAELTTAALAEAIGIAPQGLRPCLEAAQRAGYVSCRMKDKHHRAPMFWRLTSVAAPKAQEQPRPQQLPARTVLDVPIPAPWPEIDQAEPRASAAAAGSTDQDSNAQWSQHVLKAEPATADATDRDPSATPGPVGGPMGAGQPAAAGPAGSPLVGINATLSLSGELAIVAECGTVVLFDRARAERLRAFLAGRVV